MGRSFQLPQEGSLWLVFSGNLELGLFLEHKKKKRCCCYLQREREKSISTLRIQEQAVLKGCKSSTQTSEGWEAQTTQ